MLLSHHVSESKAVLDSGFHAQNSTFQVLDSGLLAVNIPDSNRLWDPDSLTCIVDFKA